jgi:hypothetical protein
MYVSLETLRRAVALVDSLAELDDPAGFAAIALPGLAMLVDCDVLTYNEIGPGGRHIRYADYPAGALDPATQPAFEAHVHEHPLVNHYRATGSGEPVMISDFLSRQRFHRLGLYAEFFRGIPVEHQLAVNLPGPGQEIIGIALSRSHRDFGDQDRALLNVLRAPLAAALLRPRTPAGRAAAHRRRRLRACRSHRARDPDPPAGRRWPHQRIHSSLAGCQPPHDRQTPRASLPQARGRQQGGRRLPDDHAHQARSLIAESSQRPRTLQPSIRA